MGYFHANMWCMFKIFVQKRMKILWPLISLAAAFVRYLFSLQNVLDLTDLLASLPALENIKVLLFLSILDIV